MEQSLDTQLKQVVENNIDQLEMEAIQREISRYREVERSYLNLRAEHEELQERALKTDEELGKAQSRVSELEDQHGDLVQREKLLADREAAMSVKEQIHDIKITSAKERVEDHQKMVELVFRGPVFQKSVIESRTYDQVVPTNVSDSGVMGYAQRETSLQDSRSTTTTEEQK